MPEATAVRSPKIAYVSAAEEVRTIEIVGEKTLLLLLVKVTGESSAQAVVSLRPPSVSLRRVAASLRRVFGQRGHARMAHEMAAPVAEAAAITFGEDGFPNVPRFSSFLSFLDQFGAEPFGALLTIPALG